MPKLSEKKQQVVRNFNRSEIYDAAVDLFKSHGFEGFTMQQVAEKAGMAIGTLYNYFGNKDEIITYVRESLFKKFWDSAVESTKHGNSVEKLENFTKCLFEFGLENRAIIKLFEKMQDIADRKQKLQILLKFLEDIVNTGIKNKEFKNVKPEKFSAYFLSLLLGYNSYIAEIGDFDPDKESKNIAEFLKAYFTGTAGS